MELKKLSGREIEPYLDALGALRIEVFREFPYLYDGDLAYERRYLETYVRSARSLAVLVFAGAELIGATTCLPLEDEAAEFQQPFLTAGIDPRVSAISASPSCVGHIVAKGSASDFLPCGKRTRARWFLACG